MPESYMHLYSKELLARWLRDSCRSVSVGDGQEQLLLSFDPLRTLLPLGVKEFVWTEYPICLTDQGTTLHQPWGEKVPTYEQCCNMGLPPAFILDIAVLGADNRIRYGIEIVHTHPVSSRKMAMLQLATHNINFSLYEVEASAVLAHCSPPRTMVMKKLIPGPIPLLPFGDAVM